MISLWFSLIIEIINFVGFALRTTSFGIVVVIGHTATVIGIKVAVGKVITAIIVVTTITAVRPKVRTIAAIAIEKAMAVTSCLDLPRTPMVAAIVVEVDSRGWIEVVELEVVALEGFVSS